MALAASAEEQRQLEEQSCGLFFRVAAVFGQPAASPGQAQAVTACVRQMLGDMSQGTEAVGEGAQVRAVRAVCAMGRERQALGRHVCPPAVGRAPRAGMPGTLPCSLRCAVALSAPSHGARCQGHDAREAYAANWSCPLLRHKAPRQPPPTPPPPTPPPTPAFCLLWHAGGGAAVL